MYFYLPEGYELTIKGPRNVLVTEPSVTATQEPGFSGTAPYYVPQAVPQATPMMVPPKVPSPIFGAEPYLVPQIQAEPYLVPNKVPMATPALEPMKVPVAFPAPQPPLKQAHYEKLKDQAKDLESYLAKIKAVLPIAEKEAKDEEAFLNEQKAKPGEFADV